MYDAKVSIMRAYNFPIKSKRELTPTGTTEPDKPLFNREVRQTISTLLYDKLVETITEDCTRLSQILETHNNTRDGYRALYAIMRTKFRYLQYLPPIWGPDWPQDLTAYSSILL